MSEEFSYLMLAFMIIFVVGSIGYITSSFSEVSQETYSGYLSPLVNFINDGYNFNIVIPIPILPDLDLNFNFNPFSLLGGNIQSFLTNSLLSFAPLPTFLGIPLIIILVSSVMYFIIKMIQGFIP